MKEGEKYQCVVASHITPYWGPSPQPQHVPQMGTEPVSPQFAGWHLVH